MFAGGALTSLGPCSLSLLPVTLAYLAGFEDGQTPWQRSLALCGGIVGALVLPGSLSGLLGRIYGQVPALVPTLVAVLEVLMGLNLLGLLRIPLPSGPDPERWRNKVPAPWRRGRRPGLWLGRLTLHQTGAGGAAGLDQLAAVQQRQGWELKPGHNRLRPAKGRWAGWTAAGAHRDGAADAGDGLSLVATR